MADEKRTVGEPHDRLTRIANAMLDAGNVHPERKDEKAIVFLTSELEQRSGIALGGYEDNASDLEAMVDLILHLQAIFRANGKQLLLVPLGEG